MIWTYTMPTQGMTIEQTITGTPTGARSLLPVSLLLPLTLKGLLLSCP